MSEQSNRDGCLWLVLVVAGTIVGGLWMAITWPVRFVYRRLFGEMD